VYRAVFAYELLIHLAYILAFLLITLYHWMGYIFSINQLIFDVQINDNYDYHTYFLLFISI
jgi:hypothetical protein